jgi:cell division protein ZapB
MSDTADQNFGQELARLEKRLDELVVICNQLKEENRSLKDRQDSLIADRATLLQKNEQVRARVEAMISRLKSMEHGS